MDLLSVQNVTKRFGEFVAVDNLSFSLKEGEILGLLGRNGAGKTTTIQLLMYLMQPTSGTISYFGKSLAKHTAEILQHINFSSTYISLPWFFTVSEILDVYARLYNVKDRKKRIQKLMGEFELESLAKKSFHMLSAGEKTRLLITKSFLNYPRIILLDEPTASLDVEIAVKIREFLRKEKQEYNVSILLTSHNMAEVEEMCDRVMIIKSGKIIAEDTPENLARQITDCTLHLLIKNPERAKMFFADQNITTSVDKKRFSLTIKEREVAEFLQILGKQKIIFEEIAIDKPTLEDYFLEVVNEEKEKIV